MSNSYSRRPSITPGPIYDMRSPPPNRMGFGPRGPSFGMRPPLQPHCIRPPPRMRTPPLGMMRPMMLSSPVMAHGGPGPRVFRPNPSTPITPPNRMQKCDAIKQNKVPFRSNDLRKPWVTEHMKSEFAKNEEKSELSVNDNVDDCSKFICEACDRDFQNSHAYQVHLKQHIVCKIDGCTFTAHEKIVSMHVKTQHSTGLYYKICNISTPEDIQRWKAERKLKYPTKEKIIERQKQQEEMLKRGERLTKKRRFGEKSKLRRIKRKSKPPGLKSKQKTQTFSVKTSVINEHADWNGSMFPFRGTSEIYLTDDKIKDDFEDTEWADNPTQDSHKLTLKNALGALMSAYNSSDDSDNERSPPKNPKLNTKVETKVTHDVKKSISDDELPIEEQISKNPLTNPIFEQTDDKKLESESTSNKKPNERKRKRTHFKKSKKNKVSDNSKNSDSFNNTKFVKRKTTLLEKLLENEIRHERNVLLQCVRYVVSNNYFTETN